jgi:hypothetical protein
MLCDFINNNKNNAKKFLINIFAKNIFLLLKFRGNLIKFGNAKELAQGLKSLINLNSLTLNL